MQLVIGGDSEIGGALCARLLDAGTVVAATTRRRALVRPDRPFLDLAGSVDDWEPPAEVCCACVCAAISKLVDCDRDPVGSAHINVLQTRALCARLIARRIYVLFLSTNQVFDGNTPQVHADAPTAPVSEYGRQKEAVEAWLRQEMARGADVGILRLARVLPTASGRLREWTGALRANQSVRAFYDMKLAPTPMDVVVDAAMRLLADRACGLFQLSGPRDITYAELASQLAGRLGADSRLVHAVSAASVGMPPGSTPLNTTMDSSLLRERYGLAVPDPWTLLDAIIGGS